MDNENEITEHDLEEALGIQGLGKKGTMGYEVSLPDLDLGSIGHPQRKKATPKRIHPGHEDMDAKLRDEIASLADRAKDASKEVGKASLEMRNEALAKMASALRENSQRIIEANRADVDAAEEAKTAESLIDRLMLDDARIESMASALEDLIALPDPLGKVLFESDLYNEIHLEKVSVALGLVAVIYEARPNVTADAAGIAIKSGNACILRGGSLAKASNAAISDVLRDAVAEAGLPADSIVSIESTDRRASDVLMSLHGVVDVLIPRGGAGLIAHCVENSKVPVIETGTGNCHVYIHGSADMDMAANIVRNAKCRRYGVCNAAETLLIDKAVADEDVLPILEALAGEGVLLHADERACALALSGESSIDSDLVKPADESDWATEYLAPEIAIRFVEGLDEAIEHVNKYGTKHSEAIVAADGDAACRFLREVDAAAVYHNASTAFTDGGQFGLGAEIGISTQKLHARGPFAIEALTSYKYVLHGDGQTRE